jgi:hypothetical protein
MSQTFDYERSRQTVDRLIKKFGQVGAIRRIAKTGPMYDPTLGAPTYTRVNVAELEFAKDEIDGTNILSTDKRLYVSPIGAPTDINPNTDVIMTEGVWSGAAYVGGKAFTIVPPVRSLKPAGIVVYWDIQGRL